MGQTESVQEDRNETYAEEEERGEMPFRTTISPQFLQRMDRYSRYGAAPPLEEEDTPPEPEVAPVVEPEAAPVHPLVAAPASQSASFDRERVQRIIAKIEHRYEEKYRDELKDRAARAKEIEKEESVFLDQRFHVGTSDKLYSHAYAATKTLPFNVKMPYTDSSYAP